MSAFVLKNRPGSRALRAGLGVLAITLLGASASSAVAATSYRYYAVALGMASPQPVGPVDPNFSSVTTLIHFDGSSGATSATDVQGTVYTGTSTATLSAGQARFGTTSAYIPSYWPAANFAADHSLCSLGSGDFTVEAWVYITAGQASRVLGCDDEWNIAGARGWMLKTDSFQGYGTDGSYVNTTNSCVGWQANTVTLGTWHHIAASRKSGSRRFYFDGVQQCSAQAWGATPAGGNASPLRIGAPPNGGGSMTGYVDEVRLTRGVSRYSTNFAPPTQAFPNQ